MSALQLTADEAVIIASLDTILDQVFESGIVDKDGNPLPIPLAPLQGYDSAAMQRQENLLKTMTRTVFETVMVAFLRSTAGISGSYSVGGKTIVVVDGLITSIS